MKNYNIQNYYFLYFFHLKFNIFYKIFTLLNKFKKCL